MADEGGAVVGGHEGRHEEEALREARPHALLQQVGGVDARREADDGHLRVLGLQEVEERVQEHLLRPLREQFKVVEDKDDGARLPLAPAAAVGAAPRLRAAEEVEDEGRPSQNGRSATPARCEHAELPRTRAGRALVGSSRVQVDAEVGAAGVGAERVGGGGGVGARGGARGAAAAAT